MSLRVTLLGAFTYVLLAVLIALELPLILNLSKRIDAEVKAESAGQVSLIATSASGRLEDDRRLRQLAQRSGEALGGRVIVTDESGFVVADSAGRGLEGADYSNRPEVQDALAGQSSQGKRQSESLGEEILFTAAPIVEEGETVGAVRATQSVESVSDEVRNDALALVAAGGVALLLGVGVAWILAGFLTRPLNAMADSARDVAGGDLDARAPVTGSREQRQVASAFNEMTERLQGSLEAQREFVGNASHQLRTPLTGLRLRLEAAAAHSRDDAVLTEISAAEQEVERLTSLLGNLLVLAREGQETPEPEAVDLAWCAQAAARRWTGEAEAMGRAVVMAGRGRVRVLASVDDVGIIIDNLIENALKYAAEGDVVLDWGRDGDAGFLAVSDSGPGLSAGDRERVLARFARGESGQGQAGTGLGLSIVQSLAERWSGRVSLDEAPRGLVARVFLPFAGP